jgi:DNA-binding LacI/PurR family transcriptional regulator
MPPCKLIMPITAANSGTRDGAAFRRFGGTIQLVYNVVNTPLLAGLTRGPRRLHSAYSPPVEDALAATLKDVANRAGVSVKTVSNVVHGYAHVSVELRQRVERTIAELNYLPNVAARNLRTGRSGIIALALPELDAPYFGELASLIVRAAEERSWTVLIDQTDGVRERELLVAAGIREQLIDGVIFSPRALGAAELAERVQVDRTPTVLLGERIRGGLADHVAVDNVAAAQTAVHHLADLGRRRIGVIGVDRTESSPAAHLRFEGYRAGLRSRDMAIDRDLIVPTAELHRADGAEAISHLIGLAKPPDAVFCFNDLVALGAMRTLLEHGVRIPDDIAVVGFDDIEDGRFSSPTLTTISPDKQQIAKLAVSLLLERLDGRSTAPAREVRASYRLIPRESTLGSRRAVTS